mgnify:CR=1 FL=1
MKITLNRRTQDTPNRFTITIKDTNFIIYETDLEWKEIN